MPNKEFIVTVNINFKKKYIVSAADWEHAEDIGTDEAFGDVYNIYDPDVDIHVSDVEGT